MEHHAHARMELQDALELLPQQMLNKMMPANRDIMLHRTSKKMRAAVENAKVDAVVVARYEIEFRQWAVGQVERLERVVQGDCVAHRQLLQTRLEGGRRTGDCRGIAREYNSDFASPFLESAGRGRRTGDRRGIAREYNGDFARPWWE